MYYEERIIERKLMFRNSPDGEWREHLGPKGVAVAALFALSSEERQEVISLFKI